MPQRLVNTRPAMPFVEAPSIMNEMLLANHILAGNSDPRMRRCHVPRVGEVGAVLSTCMQCATSPRAIRARYGATYHRERASLCGGASALETARARSQSSVAD